MTSRPDAVPVLSEQLCFDLYAASRAMTAAYRPLLNELGLTYPQYLVLMVLWEQGPITVREIGQELQLDHGTLTPLLKRMEEHDLVSRTRDLEDERLVRVSLTEHGDELRAHGAQVACDMRDSLGLDDAKLASLRRTLRDVSARLNAD